MDKNTYYLARRWNTLGPLSPPAAPPPAECVGDGGVDVSVAGGALVAGAVTSPNMVEKTLSTMPLVTDAGFGAVDRFGRAAAPVGAAVGTNGRDDDDAAAAGALEDDDVLVVISTAPALALASVSKL